MTSTLNGLSFAQVQSALGMAVGRNHDSADRLELSDFGDCFRVDLWWADGACASALYETAEEAGAHIRSLGFSAIEIGGTQ